jgi:hypothetical protein
MGQRHKLLILNKVGAGEGGGELENGKCLISCFFSFFLRKWKN